jgi:hypothetical protein
MICTAWKPLDLYSRFLLLAAKNPRGIVEKDILFLWCWPMPITGEMQQSSSQHKSWGEVFGFTRTLIENIFNIDFNIGDCKQLCKKMF